MGDVLGIDGTIISWAQLEARGIPSRCQGAFNSMVANLVPLPIIDDSPALQAFYVESVGMAGSKKVWKFMLRPEHCTENWLPFLDRTAPAQTFACIGQSLRKIPLYAPGPEVILRRIVVYRTCNRSSGWNVGPWTGDNILLTQYTWKGGTPLTDSSTASLRRIQNQHNVREHPAIRRWETQLDTRLPEHVWHNTWLTFRSEKVNTFMWLIIFRAIATLSWVFPDRPHTDVSTRCPRCNLGVREDILHCLWNCPSSQVCWSWIATLLTRAAGLALRVPLDAAHVFLAVSFPNSVEVPFHLWQILRAYLCWQIWKARNECIFSHVPLNPEVVIRKTWDSLSAHLRMEWKQQVGNCRSGRQSREEARASMEFLFGTEGVVWNLEDFNLQVPSGSAE